MREKDTLLQILVDLPSCLESSSVFVAPGTCCLPTYRVIFERMEVVEDERERHDLNH